MHSPSHQPQKNYRNLLLILGSMLFLSACIGGSSPATRYYMLDPVAASKDGSGTDKQLHVEIKTVRLPQYLERPQIVTRKEGNQIRLSEANQWGGNLRKNMTRTLAVNLSRMLATPNIAVMPYRGVAQPDFRIEVEIIKFELASDGKVYLSAQWRISSNKGSRDITTQISELSSNPVGTADDYTETVKSMAKLYAELSQQIASKVLGLSAQ